MTSCQQLIQQHAQRKLIAGRRHSVPARLLRAGAFGGEQVRRGAVASPFSHEFCDAKIQQFGSAVGADKNIRRLQIAMNHQLAVRVFHRGANLETELDALPQVRLMKLTPAVERESLDILHYQIGLAVFKHASVEQPRDRGMIQ